MTVENDDLAVPWWPECIPRKMVATGDELGAEWAYVYIEEIAGGIAELHRWPWPYVDQLGRLGWPDTAAEAAVMAHVPIDLLRRQLYGPSHLERVPRAGDTFAVRRPGSAEEAPWHGASVDAEAVTDCRALFPDDVLDISSEARAAAKVSYLAATAAITAPGEEAEEIEEASRASGRAEPAPVLLVAPLDGADERSGREPGSVT